METQEKDQPEDPPERLSEEELEEGGDNLDESQLDGEGAPPK